MSRPRQTIPALREARIRLSPGTLDKVRQAAVRNGQSAGQFVQAALDWHLARMARVVAREQGA